MGSIPACAGEPPHEAMSKALHRVYPRVCGGTVRPRTVAEHGYGLSPRVRGNQAHQGSFAQEQRSIPACAGEPMLVPRSALTTTVYPRVCGGTLDQSAFPP